MKAIRGNDAKPVGIVGTVCNHSGQFNTRGLWKLFPASSVSNDTIMMIKFDLESHFVWKVPNAPLMYAHPFVADLFMQLCFEIEVFSIAL